MSQNTVNVTVKVTDQSAGGFQSVQRNADGLKEKLKGVGTQAAGIFSAQLMGGAAASFASFVGSTVSAASNLNESVNAVNVTFGTSAATIRKWGEDSAASYGLSTRAFNEMATPLGAMLKNTGLSMAETADWTINLTKRAADMASVFNTEVPDALAAIQAGLRGELDPLERFGVSLSAAKVEAQAMADTGKKTAASLTDQEKSIARLHLIMQQTSQTQGDFQNTSDGLANSMRRAKAEIENAQASLGQDLLPVLAKAASGTAALAHEMTGFSGKLREFADSLPGGRSELAKFSEIVKNADGDLADMVKSGNAREAAAQVADLSARAQEMGLSVQDFSTLLPKYGEALSSTAEQSMKAAEAAKGLTGAMQEQKAVTEEAANGLLGQRGAMRNLEEAYLTATESIKENKRHLDDGTEAGRKNGDALDNIAAKAWAAADAIQKANGSQQEINAVMTTARARFIAAAGAMGMAAGDAQALADKLFAIPKNTTASVSLRDNASAGIANVGYRLRELNGSVAVVRVDYREGSSRYGFEHGGIVGQAASGGLRSNQVMVGEHGPELVNLPPGSHVQSNPDTERMLAGGGRAPIVIEIVSGGSDMDDFLMKLLRQAIRVRGGDVQVVLGQN